MSVLSCLLITSINRSSSDQPGGVVLLRQVFYTLIQHPINKQVFAEYFVLVFLLRGCK